MLILVDYDHPFHHQVAVRGMGRACGRIAERVAKYALRRLPSGHGFRYTITTSEAADAGVRSQEFVLEFDPEVGKDVLRRVPMEAMSAPVVTLVTITRKPTNDVSYTS